MSEPPSIEKEPWFKRHKSVRFRLIRFLSRRTNGLIKGPSYYSAKKYHSARNAEENDKARIPECEQVACVGIWTAEFFTPDNVQNLIRKLENLGPSTPGMPDRHPARFVRENRSRPGSSLELYLFPPTAKQSVTRIGHLCDLPAFASSAQATLVMLTPSLTILTTHFELIEGEQDRFNQALHRAYPTQIIPVGTGYSISTPDWERKKAIECIRNTWRRQATDWHKTNFRGLLVDNGETVEVCEQLVSEGVTQASGNFLDALDLRHSWGAFAGPAGRTKKPIEFYPSLRISTNEAPAVVMSDRESLLTLDFDGFGEGVAGASHYVDHLFRRTFGFWSTLRMFSFYESRLAHARDGAAGIVGRAGATKALARVREDVAVCVDAATIARELKGADERMASHMAEVDLEPRPSERPTVAQSLIDTVVEEIAHRSTLLLSNVKDLNDGLQSQANLLSAHANLKLQPWIIAIALLSLMVGAIAAEPVVRDLLESYRKE